MEHSSDAAFDELCPVCGDKVSGYHYGLLTCESCKGFFKRTVQNNKKYICADNQECIIDKTQRKRCPFCRFQKCLHVGMRLDAVRADRMRGGRNKFGPMYKHDRALKQQRKALLQSSGFRVELSPPLLSESHHRDLSFPAGFHPLPLLPSAQDDCVSYQSPSLQSLLPSCSPVSTQYQSTSMSHWTIKSEHIKCDGFPGVTGGRSSSPSSPQRASGRVPYLVMECLRCDPNELQLQNKMAARVLQEQMSWDKQLNTSTFSLMCFMADQTLCSIVEWARASTFFKQLLVSDQMKLLHSCWSELLLLDIISRQVLYGREGCLLLVTGQEIKLSDIISHAGPTLAGLVHRGQELVERLVILKVDRQEFACFKFLILFNPDVQQLEDHQYIETVQEQVEGALLEYTLCTSPHLLGRFSHLLLCLSELHSLSALAEDYLYCRLLSSDMPCNNLLIEMLHAKRSQP